MWTFSCKIYTTSLKTTGWMNGGYDAKFKIYADTIVANAGPSVHDFLYQNGSQYFTCKVDEPTVCCDICNADDKHVTYNNCDFCWTDDDCYTECDSLGCESDHELGQRLVNTKYINEDEPCPPDYSKRFTTDSDRPESVTWALVDDKATQFWADLYRTTGMNETYITFGTYDRTDGYGGDCEGDEDPDNTCWEQGYDLNFPQPIKGYDDDDVANPKDTAQKGLARSGTFPDQIETALFEMSTDAFVGDGTAIIDAVSVPILMIVSAVEEMAKVESIATEVSAEEKKYKGRGNHRRFRCRNSVPYPCRWRGPRRNRWIGRDRRRAQYRRYRCRCRPECR